ncbi:alpha/beta fold hydrolase [Alteromonas sp. ASW11-19]|uniref:Alpha/beta fold hydrolase n=1 Tax=Alteromonas salexigens TaxID=2982530 RepID=A0ABT2VMB3_9ALTE|nr:alpha/beta fold hydrolase [Alteromonas salexigens]MCU7554003.1 alpha/beta fold hydrolase [Alteromonas salexigens]
MPDALHYSDTEGDKKRPVLLLIHGLFGDLNNLAVIRRHFEKDFRVISVDLPDHGQSPRLNTFTLDAAVACLHATVSQLSLSRFILLGHSLGGKVALRFALHHPELVHQVMAADIAPVSYPHRHQSIIAGLESVSLASIQSRQQADEQLAKHIAEAGVRQFLLKSLYQNEAGQWQWRFNLSGLKASYSHISDWPAMDAQYQGPVLFIKGGDSEYILPEHRSAIASYFPAAKAHVINGAGHWLHAEKPQLFNAIVEKQLAKCK